MKITFITINVLAVGTFAAPIWRDGDLTGRDTKLVQEPTPQLVGAVGKPLGIGLGSVVSSGSALYSKVSACLANIKINQPCLAGDGTNIRQILKELRELKEKVEGNHKEVVGNIDLVRTELKRQNYDSRAYDLGDMEKHVGKTTTALVSLIDCLVAAESANGVCTSFNGVTQTKNVPVRDAVLQNQLTLVDLDSLITQDVSDLVTTFAGLASTGYRGLAYHYWMYIKHMQDVQAEVTEVKVKEMDKVPVVTPKLANSMNQFLTYYRDLFDQYAMTRPFVALMQAKDERERILAENLAARVQDEIYNKDQRGSVRATLELFRLPILNKGELVLMTVDGKRGMHVYAGAGGNSEMHADKLKQIGRVIKSYGKYSSLRANNLDAFPEDEVYGVWNYAGVREQRLAHSKTVNVLQLGINGGIFTGIKMRVRDDIPTTGPNFIRYYDSVNFQDIWNQQMTAPAEYDWFTVNTVVCSSTGRISNCNHRDIGKGAWLTRGDVRSSFSLFDHQSFPLLSTI